MALRIIEALDAYLRALDNGTDGEIGAAVNQLRWARTNMTFATEIQIQCARSRYADRSSDNLEVDDGALTSEGDGGTWVNAWVWLED